MENGLLFQRTPTDSKFSITVVDDVDTVELCGALKVRQPCRFCLHVALRRAPAGILAPHSKNELCVLHSYFWGEQWVGSLVRSLPAVLASGVVGILLARPWWASQVWAVGLLSREWDYMGMMPAYLTVESKPVPGILITPHSLACCPWAGAKFTWRTCWLRLYTG